MSNPSEINPSPRIAEIRSDLPSPKKRWLRGWVIAFLVLFGASTLWWSLSRPSLTPLGVREINGYDYLCFRIENETTADAQVSIYYGRQKMVTPVSYTTISRTDRGIWKRAEIGIPIQSARKFSGGKPVRIQVVISPHTSPFEDKLRGWLSVIIPARFVGGHTILNSEDFIP